MASFKILDYVCTLSVYDVNHIVLNKNSSECWRERIHAELTFMKKLESDGKVRRLPFRFDCSHFMRMMSQSCTDNLLLAELCVLDILTFLHLDLQLAKQQRIDDKNRMTPPPRSVSQMTGELRKSRVRCHLYVDSDATLFSESFLSPLAS